MSTSEVNYLNSIISSKVMVMLSGELPNKWILQEARVSRGRVYYQQGYPVIFFIPFYLGKLLKAVLAIVVYTM